jgi:hypothetical protein
MPTIRALLRSRKVLVAIFAVVQALVLNYANVDPEVWGSISALAAVLIASIAYEDGQAKSAAPQQIQVNNPPADASNNAS